MLHFSPKNIFFSLQVEESDEDDQYLALSDKWKFEENVRRWSRCDLPSPTLVVNGDITAETTGIRSCSSHDSLLSDEEGTSNQGSPPNLNHSHHLTVDISHGEKSPFPSPDSALSSNSGKDTSVVRSPRLVRAASERLKGAKNFLKRMESFKSKKKKKQPPLPEKLEIGAPVLVENAETIQRMDELGCVEISPSSVSEMSPISGSSSYPPGSGSDGDAAFSDSDCSPMVEKRAIVERSVSHDPQLHHGSSTPKPNTSHNCDVNKEYLSVDSHYKPGAFPRVLANGCIDLVDGSQINYRTGSFNFGAESTEFRQSVLRRARGASHDPSVSGDSVTRGENRQSLYDNVPQGGDVDPQKELDLILQDLYKDINGLSESLAQHDHTGETSLIQF